MDGKELAFIHTLCKGLICATVFHGFILYMKGFQSVYLLMLLTHTYIFSYIFAVKNDKKKKTQETLSNEFFLLPGLIGLVSIIIFGVLSYGFVIISFGDFIHSNTYKSLETMAHESVFSAFIFYLLTGLYWIICSEL